MNVSLILATYGRAEELGRAIKSFLLQTDQDFELIIVDQNLDDRVEPYVKMAQDNGLDVRHVRMDRPSLSAARNLGISLARHDILAFPDDDCWYEIGVIEQVKRAFNADPVLGGVVARWVERAGSSALSREYLLDYSAWRKFRGGHASSISLFFNCAIFKTLGGFDERFGVGQWFGAGEEIDFILRALSADARVKYCPEVLVHHAYSPDPVGSLFTICRQARRRSRGTGALYAKHKLPIYVVMRGLFAPVATALPHLSPTLIARGIFTSLGRIEGYLGWRTRELRTQ